MSDLGWADWLGFAGAASCVVALIACIRAIILSRRPDLSMRKFLIGAPLWYFTPRRYFAAGKVSAPWRWTLWWYLYVFVIVTLVNVIPYLVKRATV
jgi:hypothetical protein